MFQGTFEVLLEQLVLLLDCRSLHISKKQGNEESAAPVFSTAINFGSYYKILCLLSVVSAFK